MCYGKRENDRKSIKIACSINNRLQFGVCVCLQITTTTTKKNDNRWSCQLKTRLCLVDTDKLRRKKCLRLLLYHRNDSHRIGHRSLATKSVCVAIDYSLLSVIVVSSVAILEYCQARNRRNNDTMLFMWSLGDPVDGHQIFDFMNANIVISTRAS